MTSNDLVVVLPGITGSTLGVRGSRRLAREREPHLGPERRRGLEAADGAQIHPQEGAARGHRRRAHPDDGVEPVALMPDVHVLPGIWTPIRGYDVLVELPREARLQARQRAASRPTSSPSPTTGACPTATTGSAWGPWSSRRSSGCGRRAAPRRTPGSSSSCHSMGGLVARWYIEKCGGAEVTRKLITLGTPWRGATDALEQLVNGVKKGIGPLSIDLTAFSRSMPSLYQLLPEYACISNGGGYAKTTEVAVPNLVDSDADRRDGLPHRPPGRRGGPGGEPRHDPHDRRHPPADPDDGVTAGRAGGRPTRPSATTTTTATAPSR